jgi:hypothetical protein
VEPLNDSLTLSIYNLGVFEIYANGDDHSFIGFCEITVFTQKIPFGHPPKAPSKLVIDGLGRIGLFLVSATRLIRVLISDSV